MIKKTIVESLEFSDLVDLFSLFDGASYWVDMMDFKDEDFIQAKKDLMFHEVSDDVICREDIWAMMLQNNCSFWFYDEEGESYELNDAKLLKGLNLYFNSRNAKQEIEDMDAEDGDMILQYALFGEVIYG